MNVHVPDGWLHSKLCHYSVQSREIALLLEVSLFGEGMLCGIACSCHWLRQSLDTVVKRTGSIT